MISDVTLPLPLLVVVPLIAAAFANLLHKRYGALRVIGLALILLLPAMMLFAPASTEHHYGAHTVEQAPDGTDYTLGIEYQMTPIHRFLILLLFTITSLVLFASLSEFQNPSGAFLYLLFMSVGATAAVLLVNDVFNLYVFVEIAAIAQAGLVIAYGSAASFKTALKYLLMGSIAGNLLLVGIAMLLLLGGSLNVGDYASLLTPDLLGTKPGKLALALFLFALTYVSGLVPYHTIKAHLYAKTIPHAGALIQSEGKLLFAGLAILTLRIFGPVDGFRHVLLAFGFLAMVLGALMALTRDNYLEVLGYTSVSQVGYIATGFGLATAGGIQAALFHTVNDILYMSALFIGAGYLYYKVKTLDMAELGGLLPAMPAFGTATLAGILAVSAIPPFNGFQSELLLIKEAIAAGYMELGILMVLVGIATFVALSRAFYLIFLGVPTTKTVAKDTPAGTLFAFLFLLACCLLIGLYPQFILDKLPMPVIMGWLP